MPPADRLSEVQVVESFHLLLRESFRRAQAEGLLSEAEISAADIEVQVAGPALTLFYAALEAQGDPPCISSPDGSFTLSSENCPAPLASAFRLWQECVPRVRRYDEEARGDLARMVCEKEPEGMPLRMDVARTAADLKGIALEILQRRTFQIRFQADLQSSVAGPTAPAGLPAARGSPPVAYEPPPLYSAEGGSDRSRTSKDLGSQSRSVTGAGEAHLSGQEAEHLAVIRETLYGALADVLVTTPSILRMLAQGPEWTAKAFFASTCLAILEVALVRVTAEGVRAVNLGRGSPRVIGIRETPAHLRPFLSRLVEVSQAVRALAEEDDARAVREATEGVQQLSPPRLDLLRTRLSEGVGANATGSESEMGQIALLANGINGLALGMTSLPAFQERQAQAFQILMSVTSL
ncbi:hypothetical protein JCM8202_006075 [Rhodotorula sphaerocarpa]